MINYWHMPVIRGRLRWKSSAIIQRGAHRGARHDELSSVKSVAYALKFLPVGPRFAGRGSDDTRMQQFDLRRASRMLGQLYDDALAPSGLRATQHGLLAQIAIMDGPTLRDLAAEIVMDLSALGHTLKPLIRDGYVALVPDKDDRRVKHAMLTKAGQKKLKQTSKLGRKHSGVSRTSSETSGPPACALFWRNSRRKIFGRLTKASRGGRSRSRQILCSARIRSR